MRLTEAVLWPDPFAETEPKIWLGHYERAVTKPPLFDSDARAFEWDHDHFALNLVGHGLLGSELFYRPRRCGHAPLASFIFATGASTTWEYVFEGNGVRPSALDLVYTPIAGIALGEMRFWGVTWSRAIRDPFLRGFVRALLDPFGEIERGLGAPC
jgi:hypothetical protein